MTGRLCHWLCCHMPAGNWICRPCYYLTLVAPSWVWCGTLRMWIAWRAWAWACVLDQRDRENC